MTVQAPNPKADRRKLVVRRRRGNAAERDANVIPLIDIVFILILYFMLAGSLDQELIEALTPPQSKSLQPPPSRVPRVVVDKNGQVTYAKTAYDDAGLAAALNDNGHPPPKLALHADAEADAGRVADVIAIIGRAGVSDLSLITRPATVRH